MVIEIIKNISKNERQIWTFNVTEEIRLLSLVSWTKDDYWSWETKHECFQRRKNLWGRFLDPAFGKAEPRIPADVKRNLRQRLSEWAKTVPFVKTKPNKYRNGRLIKIGG